MVATTVCAQIGIRGGGRGTEPPADAAGLAALAAVDVEGPTVDRLDGAAPDDGVLDNVAPSVNPADVEPWVPPTWDEIVRTHSPRVYRLAYRLTGNPHDAEDLTHEVFLRVFRSLSSYTPGTFEGWLHRITTNLFLDLVRRRARVRFEALPDNPDRIVGREKSPAQAYEDTQLDGDVQAALDGLPADFRAAVVLCDIEGLSYEEIAATLGIKLGTVRSRIHRGRAQLRAALAHRAGNRVRELPGEGAGDTGRAAGDVREGGTA